MKNTSRIIKQTTQLREYAVNSNGIGRKWIPKIEKIYTFNSVDEFIRTFKPLISSENLTNAIAKAYNECKSVTFNVGKGNETFYFKKAMDLKNQ